MWCQAKPDKGSVNASSLRCSKCESVSSVECVFVWSTVAQEEGGGAGHGHGGGVGDMSECD